MPIIGDSDEVYTTPKTPEQLRVALWATKKQDSDLQAQIDALDVRVDDLESGETFQSDSNYTATNNSGSTMVICEPVYVSGNLTVSKARANAAGTSRGVGLVLATSIANSATGLIQTSGIFEATTGQWDTVTGQSGGLTPNTVYYLSAATAGRLTTTAPSTSGQFVLPMGIAVSTTRFKLAVLPRVTL